MAIPKPRVRLTRPDVLHGVTYRIYPPVIEEAIYITVNSTEVDGQERPVEILLNSRHTKNFVWAQALMRLLSAVLQQPGDFSFFALKELSSSMDPDGAYWIKPKTCGNPSDKSIQCPSVIAHIGLVLEEHCRKAGLVKEDKSRRDTPHD